MKIVLFNNFFALICLMFFAHFAYGTNLMKMKTDSQSIRIGPIIGSVTESTARILVEFTLAGQVTMILTDKGNGRTFKSTLTVQAKFPIVFKFSGLSKYTVYTISFSPNLTTVSGSAASFRTLRGDLTSTNFNVAFISCNDIVYAKSLGITNNLWTDLALKVENGQVDYVIHFGDQVYLDHDAWLGNTSNAYTATQNKYGSLDFTKYSEEIRDAIRQVYFDTWTFQPTADLLSHVPNIMMPDDHDIFDNFGWKSTLFDTSSFDYFWSKQARFVFYQYQRQLREDIDFANYEQTSNEFFSVILNKVGFIFLDIRGIRTWHKVAGDPDSELGSLQTKVVDEAFSDTGIFNDVRAVVVVSTIPIVLFPKQITQAAEKYVVDLEEHWDYKHEDELHTFFDLLRRWQSKNPNKELLIVGGDVHLGGHTELYYHKNNFVHQLVTSGINQINIPKYRQLLYNGLLGVSHTLTNDYCWYHFDWTIDKNYGLAKFSIQNNQNPHIETQLVTTDGTTKPKDQTSYDANVFKYNDQILYCGNILTKVEDVVVSAADTVKKEVTQDANTVKKEVTQDANTVKKEVTQDANTVKNDVTKVANKTASSVVSTVNKAKSGVKKFFHL